MSLYFDAARMRWYRYVVNWSLRDQVQLAATVHRQAADARVALAWPRDWRVSPAMGTGAGIAVAVALLWWVRRYGYVLPRTGPAARMPASTSGPCGPARPWAGARRCPRPRGSSPARWGSARRSARPRSAASPGYYERARFGDAALSEAERQDVTARWPRSARDPSVLDIAFRSASYWDQLKRIGVSFRAQDENIEQRGLRAEA